MRLLPEILALAAAVCAALALSVWQCTIRSIKQANVSGEQQFWPEELNSQLEMPSSMVWLPDGSMLIAQRNGEVRIIRDGVLASEPLRGVPKAFPGFYEGIKVRWTPSIGQRIGEIKL